MATYYCKTSGDDALDGLSEANAWLTITMCVTTLVAGDIVYIAPGTYRNVAGWICINAGAVGNIIQYIGDPDCEHFTNENPGYVRLTGCDAAELPSCAVSVFNYNNKNYITLKDAIVDGAENNLNARGITLGAGTERNAENCIAFGCGYAFNEGTQTNCVAVGMNGFLNGTQNNCIGFGYFAFSGGTQNNCIASGGRNGFSGGTQNNCIAFGGENGFLNTVSHNCISIGGAQGFAGGTQDYCIAMACVYGYATGAIITLCKAIYCRFTQSGTVVGVATASNCIGFTNLRMLKNLARWLKPDLFFEKDTGDDTILPAVTEDILGQPRRMHDGTIDIGAFEYSDIEMDWADFKVTPPGIKINRKGVQEFKLPAKIGKQITVKVWVKFNVTVGSEPQLILRGEGIATQTATAVSDGSGYEKLAVNAIPNYDDVLIVRLYQRDTTLTANAIFSDIRVN